MTLHLQAFDTAKKCLILYSIIYLFIAITPQVCYSPMHLSHQNAINVNFGHQLNEGRIRNCNITCNVGL